MIYQSSSNLSPRLKMFLNVMFPNYWKFCPADAVLAGILTSSTGLQVTQDPLETCSWECAGLYGTVGCLPPPPFLFCAPLTDRRVSLGICLVPGLAHLCCSVHTISCEGYKEDFY